MVAGIVHLVAPTAKIMPLKAFRADGTSNLSTSFVLSTMLPITA